MNNFFLLRGLPGSGKSTWIAYNGLNDITISSDQMRIEMSGFEYDENNVPRISQKNAHIVWSMIRSEAERRMQFGEDVIIDSTMLKEKDMRAWEPFVFNYGYHAYVVDFTDIDFDICFQNNIAREDYRIVSDEKMEQMYHTMKSNFVPPCYTIITPEEALQILNM